MKNSDGHSFILLAEDDVAYGESLAELLRKDGHCVRHVTDGEEAVRVMRTHGHKLALVLTDLLLPRRTGFQVAREALEAGVDAPILVMTGVYGDMRDVHALKTLGVKGWIHKSAPFEHILFRVNSLLWPASKNERRSARVAVSVPVQFRIGERVHYATTYNVSATGVYVRSPETFEAGTQIELALSLPTAAEMVTTAAEIVHAASVDDVRGTAYPAGFGARFLDPAPHASAAVRNFVDWVIAEEASPVAPAGPLPVTEPEPEPAMSR